MSQLFGDPDLIAAMEKQAGEPLLGDYGHKCDNCGVFPLICPRYACEVCEDYDLCRYCIDDHKHNKDHGFRKM